MESPVDKGPVDSITEELERPLLDQFFTKSYSSHEYTSDTHVSKPMFDDIPSMTTDDMDVILYTSSCPDLESMRGTSVTEPMFEEAHDDFILCHTRSCPSVICMRDTPVTTEPMYEEYSTMATEIARDTCFAPPWNLNLKGGHGSAPFSQAQCQTENLNMKGGHGSARFPQAQCQTETCYLEGDHKPTPKQARCQIENLNLKGGHGSAPFSQAQRQTENLSMKGGHGSEGQTENLNMKGGHGSERETENLNLKGGHGSFPFSQAQRQTENLNLKGGHGSFPFSQAQRQTENLNLKGGHGSFPFSQAQRQTENLNLKGGHGSERQTENLNFKGGHGSDPFSQAQRQTKNHDVEGGHKPDPQLTRHQTKVDDPASDVMYLVRLLLGIYMIMLAYLGWGPTSQSPRQIYMILYWVSIGMLVYAIIAVLVVLKMYKMGGAWTWWATFFRYTISLAALIGCVVLLVFVSHH